MFSNSQTRLSSHKRGYILRDVFRIDHYLFEAQFRIQFEEKNNFTDIHIHTTSNGNDQRTQTFVTCITTRNATNFTLD